MDDPKFFDEEGDYAWVRISDVTSAGMYLSETEQKLSTLGSSLSVKLQPGALFLSIAATVGQPAITKIKCCIHDGFVYFPRFKGDPRFLFYVFASGEPYKGLGKLGTQLNLNTDTVGSIIVGFPDVAEQRAIADFLDAETTKLDTLVAKKRELIEKLKEKRSALISRTVTRGLPPEAARAAGLDPRPKLKPSGIEWFGEIPEHWEVLQLRRRWLVLDCKHRTVPFIDDGMPLASIQEVQGFEIDLSNAKQTTEENYIEMIEGERKPTLGDIIYSRNATVGAAALVTTAARFCMGQDVCLIRSKVQVPKYVLYLFRSCALIEQVESLMIGSTFRRVNVGQIKSFWVCMPPTGEQRAIADYLDSETNKVDRMVEKVEEAIERLQEYRTALITAAVTGKIDVRNVRHSGESLPRT
jgi:type I restriction enzyme S subunit